VETITNIESAAMSSLNGALIFRQTRGFSLVELVVVIVLLGIVGVVVVPRFMAPNAFNALATRDGIVATIRAAQQASIGRSLVTFKIVSTADSYRFLAEAGAGNTTIREFEVGSRDLVLKTGSAVEGSLDTCATGYDEDLDNFTLTFNGQGSLVNFSNGPLNQNVGSTFNGVRICLNDTDAMSVCVSPLGYAYVGNCDD
jgi:prepilin-type N-terminal cleavage/methylation domain-containing protein